MPRRLAALLFFLALLPAAALGETQVFAASTTGEMVIGTDGQVAELSLDRKSLGNDVMAAIEARVRSWRFQPTIDAGRPVQLKARLRLDMLALRERGVHGLTLAIRNVQFLDPPGPHDSSTGSAQHRPKLQRPGYPETPARANVGATVWLAVRVGEDGEVTDVAVEAAELRSGQSPGPVRESSYAREFARSAENAARHWRLPGHAGLTVTVPVVFRIGEDSGERWMRVHNVPQEVPAWVAAERGTAIQLSDSGEQGSSRVQLLSAIN